MNRLILLGIARVTLLICLTIFFTVVQISSAHASNKPVIVPNSLPIATGAGLPLPSSAKGLDLGQVEVALLGNIQSHANDAGSDTEQLFIDAESHSFGVRLRWGFAESWSLSADLGAIKHTAGSLDGPIDNWHDLFGLSNGDRADFAQDSLQIAYLNSTSGTNRNITTSQQGFRDVQLGVTYQWLSNDWLNIASQLNLALPIGRSPKLTGSDELDLSLAILASSENNAVIGWHANVGLLATGDDALFDIPTQDLVWFSSLGLHWQASQRWRWSTQLDGHAGIFKSQISELQQNAWQLALAVDRRIGSLARSNKSVQLYFTEDLTVNRAADFSLGLNVVFEY